ncbi:thioredoxin domain-containing protein [Geomobilimonas luticola]|uniref:Thioredoxin domain-containing protein n=1 Tax=Geomobilimonas luticola TaxID=1114878 RepID=A0ABS5SGN2_9BACT|nr:thioredoxin domain-containing protein [Geomobilimonas luticola]MBT0654516.1 thioredoxin domain-containing protein [Geomobilimonas luticola]
MNDTEFRGDCSAGAHLHPNVDRRSLPPDGGERFNRLIFATSPYLLQHAENPVDWYPWGEEAFARAATEDKPVLLSIGYATCHWCHVMAHESFADSDVAEVINRHFVAIKVDREERPDIDDRYMTVSQMMTGSGGWPLNIVMTPDRRPFFAATYIPKTRRQGMPGVVELLEKLAALWRTERDRIEESCASVMQALTQLGGPAPAELPGDGVLADAYGQLRQMYDETWGGFGTAPKFPMPHYLQFLLRIGKRTGDASLIAMVTTTLARIRQRGIFDQVGFGLHRYSVDRQWVVPHFEKMLYDQAMVTLACIEAFQATGSRNFLKMAEEVAAYVLVEMTGPEGGFYAAQDADTEGEEGRYYVWTPAEIEAVLGHDAAICCRLWGVTASGNFGGRTILNLPLSIEEFARREGVTPDLLDADLARWRERLLVARSERVRPFRDEKVLTAWNGLMIAALARLYGATGEARWLGAAERAMDFIRMRLVDGSGRLFRSYHGGRGDVPGFLEDYAAFVSGLIALYEGTLVSDHLEEAVRLSRQMLSLFQDPESGGLFDTGNDAEAVLGRSVNPYDGVTPSGTSLAALNLLKLGGVSGAADLAAAGEAVLRSAMGKAVRQPAGYLCLLMAYDYLLGPAVEISLAGDRNDPEMLAMLRVIGCRFIPRLVLRHAGGDPSFLEREGKATAYVCANEACRPPAVGAAALGRLLDEVA